MQELLTLEYDALPHEEPPTQTLVSHLIKVRVDGFGKDRVWVDAKLSWQGAILSIFGALHVRVDALWEEAPNHLRLGSALVGWSQEGAAEAVLALLQENLTVLQDLAAQRVEQERRRALEIARERVAQLKILLIGAERARLLLESEVENG